MKIAQLHNGIQIHFPDDMPDDQMDMEVQNYLAGGGAAPGQDSMALVGTGAPAGVQPPPAGGGGDVMQMMLAGMQNFTQVQRQEQAQRVQDEKAEREQERQESAQELQAQQEMAGWIADAIGQLVDNVSQPVHEIAKNSQQAGEIVKALNNLSETIVEAAKMITSVLMMPVDLNRARDGTPTGMERVSQRKLN